MVLRLKAARRNSKKRSPAVGTGRLHLLSIFFAFLAVLSTGGATAALVKFLPIIGITTVAPLPLPGPRPSPPSLPPLSLPSQPSPPPPPPMMVKVSGGDPLPPPPEPPLPLPPADCAACENDYVEGCCDSAWTDYGYQYNCKALREDYGWNCAGCSCPGDPSPPPFPPGEAPRPPPPTPPTLPPSHPPPSLPPWPPCPLGDVCATGPCLFIDGGSYATSPNYPNDYPTDEGCTIYNPCRALG